MKNNKSMELFIVVDDKDNILEFLPEDECHAKGVRHRTSSIVVFNNKGEILLQHRSPSKKLFPGMYTVSASGHVSKKPNSDTAESYEEAAVKEFKEELGIDPPALKFVKMAKIEASEHPTITAIYTTTHNGPFKLTPDEVSSVKFFKPEQIKNLLPKLTPNGKKVLQELGII